MLTNSFRIAAGALALALCAAPAHAAKVSGTLDGFTVIKQQDKDVEHALVRVTLQDGSRQVVDLGSRLCASKLGLEQGDEIKIMGQQAEVDGRQVVKARRILVDGQSFALRSADKRRSKGPAKIRAQGTISGFKKIKHPKTRSDNLWVRLSMQDGDSCIIDLGPLKNLSSLDLDQGDQIKVAGIKSKHDGDKLIIARNLVIKDESSGDVTRYIRRPVRGPEQGDRSSQSKQQRQNSSGQQQADHAKSKDKAKGKECPHCLAIVPIRQQSISGTVAATKSITVDAQGKQHKLLKLKLEDGDSQIVNLSPAFGRDFLAIEQGDSIAVRGFNRKIDGKQVLMATSLIVLD